MTEDKRHEAGKALGCSADVGEFSSDFRRVVAEKPTGDANSKIAAQLAQWPTTRYGLARGFTL